MTGRDSVVGTATRYGLDSPGIEFRLGRDFLHLSRQTLGPTRLPIQWVPILFLGEGDVALTTHLHLAPRLRKLYSNMSTPPLSLHAMQWL